MSLFQPSNQIKLTNVAVVRYKSHGKRFEVACYKNKILNWRSGVEWDLDEVLQIRTIFTNVSKGRVASSDDLNTVFGTSSIDNICKTILSKGEIQISESERSYMLDKQFTDICHMLNKMTVNPKNNLPLSVKIIESELKDSGFSISLNKTTKEQALKAFEILKKRIPDQIERAKMMLKLSVDIGNKQNITKRLNEFNVFPISSEEKNNTYTITFLCEPRYFREIDQLDCKLLLLDSNVKTMDKNSNFNNAEAIQPELSQKSDILSDSITTDIRHIIDKKPEKKEVSIKENANTFVKSVASSLNTEESKSEINTNMLFCRKCNIHLMDHTTFKQHYRTEWHIFNTKRNARKMEPVSEKEFLELQQDIKLGFLAVE
ncbi:rRNA metabolism protein SBDS family [Cryptosporidium meleagridis]|uniref:rRNA metabolism protein SBDS family n=1 Tax=Cryptosporidium meleagridis TaxID=93969 RepID=A0A2P4Z425_9CRYT|nr:rRNA metabolism protein SBDS family [Cryptosporidium meleagridis]